MAAYSLRVFEPIIGRSSSVGWSKSIRHPVAIPEVRYWHKSVLRWHSTATRLHSPRPNRHSILYFDSPLNVQTRLIPGSTSTGRGYSSDHHGKWKSSNRQTFTYVAAVAITVVGLSYAAVPLYRIYCQASGYGGTVSKADAGEKIEQMVPIEERELTIRFNANRNSGMRWTFKPQQTEIKLVPGETALAFYTATNPTDQPITGIATYNVLPFDAGQYFNKIQCFCFEEQRLNPHEEVDMPVFFYIDPEFAEDPLMAKVDSITLSYTFFEAKDGENIDLPVPEFLKQ